MTTGTAFSMASVAVLGTMTCLMLLLDLFKAQLLLLLGIDEIRLPQVSCNSIPDITQGTILNL